MNAKVKKGAFMILSVVVFAIVATMVTTFLRYDAVYLPFADGDDVQVIDTTKVIQQNDLEDTEEGYVITGPDAFLVYKAESVHVREAYIAFEKSFDENVILQVFVRSTKIPFSDDNSQTVSLTVRENTAMIPVRMKEEVEEIRVDIVAPEGTEFRLTGIHVDTKQAQSVLEYFHASYFFMYILVGIFLLFIVIYRKKIAQYVLKFYKENKNTSIMLIVWLVLILSVFGVFLIGKYNLTVTNFMYAVAPWNSLGVEHSGPNLSDPADQILPLIYKIYYSGSPFSFWNSNIALGTGESLEFLWYPLNWIYLLPLEAAILLKQIIKISIAYFGMFFFTKKMKLSAGASAFSAVIYACSSAMIVWFFWPHTDVMMFAPWIFLSGYNLIYQPKIKDALFLGLVVWLMLVSGMPTFAAYVIYLLGFYVLFMTMIQYKKELKKIFRTYVLFGIGIVEGVILSLPYIVSLVNDAVANGYAESRKIQARDILETEYLRTLFFPYARENFSKHINESSLYIGIAAIIFIGITIISLKKIKQKFWIISGIILNILIFTHWLDEIFVLMPGINTSSKVRLINDLMFVLCILAGIGVDMVWRNREHLREKKYLFLRAGTYVVILIWYSWYVSELYQYDETVSIAKGYIILLTTMAVVEIILHISNKMVKKVAMGCLLFIAVADMSNYCFEYLPKIEGEAEIVPEATDSICYLQDNIDDARFYSIGDWVLFPETNVYYGLNSLTSHNFVNTNDDVLNMLTSIDDEVNSTRTAFHGSKVDNYELLKWCGVKYIVIERANKTTHVTEGSLVYEGKDGLNIYEQEQYADKLFLSEEVKVCDNKDTILNEMGEKYEANVVYIEEAEEYEASSNSPLAKDEGLEITQDEEDYIKAAVTVKEDRFLVLNEYNDGNWKVYIDGKEAELVTVNYLFKGVYVPEGEHVVEFVYDTDMIIYLSVLSGAVLVTVLIWGGVLKIKKRKENKTGKVQG